MELQHVNPPTSRCFNCGAVRTAAVPFVSVDTVSLYRNTYSAKSPLKAAGCNGDMDYVVRLHAIHKHDFHLKEPLFAFCIPVEFGSS
jgi:hypothetical protein